MSRRAGLTIAELLVVIVILVVLAAALTFAIAPSAKARAKEVRLKSDMRQIATAMAIYRTDSNDTLPASQKCLYDSAPGKLPAWELDKSFVYPTGMPHAGKVRYLYTMPWELQQIHEKVPLKTPFDESKDSVIKAGFWRKRTGTKVIPHHITLWPSGEVFDQGREPVKVLGARLDGSIDWVWMTEDFQAECMNYYGLLRYPE